MKNKIFNIDLIVKKLFLFNRYSKIFPMCTVCFNEEVFFRIHEKKGLKMDKNRIFPKFNNIIFYGILLGRYHCLVILPLMPSAFLSL